MPNAPALAAYRIFARHAQLISIATITTITGTIIGTGMEARVQ